MVPVDGRTMGEPEPMKLLLIDLGARPRLSLCRAVLPARIERDGEEFARFAVGADEFLRFYDWLRTTGGPLVGLRMILAEGTEALDPLLPAHDWIGFDRATRTLVLHLVESTEPIDEEASTGQDFGRAIVYHSAQGSLMLAVDAALLEDHELAALVDER